MFQDKIVLNQTFNMFNVCMWTVWCTKLKNTHKPEVFEETECLRFFVQNIKLRRKHASFWTLASRPCPTEQVQSNLQPKVSTYFTHYRLRAKFKFQKNMSLQKLQPFECFSDWDWCTRQNVALQNNHSKTSINWSSSTCKYTAIKCSKLKSLFHQKTSEKNNWRVFLSVSIYPFRVCKDSLVQNGPLKLSTLFHVVVHKDFKHNQTCTF